MAEGVANGKRSPRLNMEQSKKGSREVGYSPEWIDGGRGGERFVWKVIEATFFLFPHFL